MYLSEQQSNSSNFTVVPVDGFLAVGQTSGENFTAPACPRMSESNSYDRSPFIMNEKYIDFTILF